jgi:hypothetical protein
MPQTSFQQSHPLEAKGLACPSIENKIQTRIKTVSNAHKILPITKTIVEVASFDMQKIKNPDMSEKDCQNGEQLGFWNVRESVLFRDGHVCQGRKNCKNPILNVHHIETRRVGCDAPNNLTALCTDCHSDYRDAAFIGIGAPLSASRRKVEAKFEEMAIFQKRRVHGDYEAGVLQQAEGRISECGHGIRLYRNERENQKWLGKRSCGRREAY